MARIRTVKPEFWSHPVMGKIDDTARCVALALLNYADDKGYFYADPILVRNFCRPFDEDSTNTRRSLETLRKAGWIEICGSPNNGDIGKIVNFLSHQKIDHASPSRIEKYFDSTRIRLGFDEDSTQDWILDHGMDHGMDHPQTPKPGLFDDLDASGKPKPTPVITPIFTSVRKTFQDKGGMAWGNAEKELEALHWLETEFGNIAAREQREVSEVAQDILDRFWKIREKGRDFWKTQPYTPSRLKAVWTQLLTETAAETGETDVERLIRESTEISERNQLEKQREGARA